MKFFSLFALFAFSCLASAEIDPKKQTISDLYSQVTKLRHKVADTISGLKQHDYDFLAGQADKYINIYEISSFVKRSIEKLPIDSTYETNKEAKQFISELIKLKFVYPIIGDPARFTDALKVEALFYGLKKESRKDTTKPNYTELRKSVLEIIDEENKIGQNWTKTNEELDAIYLDIDVNEDEALIVTSDYPEYALGRLKNACSSEKEAKCSPKQLEAILMMQNCNNNLHKLLPVQSAEVVENVIEALKKYIKQKAILDEVFPDVECDGVVCRFVVKHH